VRLLVTVATDGRILSKALRVDGKTRLTLTCTYEGGRVKAAWTTPDGKTHEGAEMRAEPFTPDADTFRADTTGLTVIDMPLRRPAYYDGKLKELAGAEGIETLQLLRQLALSHIQELNWRRWGGRNQEAIQAMEKLAAASEEKPDDALRLTLGDLTLAASAGRHDLATKWAKGAGVSDATPLVAYYTKRRQGWQKPAELRDSVRAGLIGHLAAYHAALATDKDIEPFRALVRDFGRSPLLYAAAAWRGHAHVERLFELFDQPRWQLLATVAAAHWAKTDAHRDRIAEGFAKMHAGFAEEGAELPVPSNIVAFLKRGDGAAWKAVLAGARKVALDSKRIAPLLRFAELAMRNGEGDAADEAIARATELAGDGRPLLLKLTVAQAYWAGNRQKDALRLYEEILAALEEKGVPPSSVLLAAAARLAQQAGDMGKAIDYEERALVLEHEHLPELINLQAFRRRYQWLWGRYQEKVTQAVQAGDADEASTWIERAEAMWRRWFDVDPDNRSIVSQMATLQMTADRPEAAWLYLSTLIDAKPKDAGTFGHLAGWHLGRKERDKAETYYARAFECDTANPQWLYQRGKVLRDMGRKADSDRVLDQVINGKWAPGLERYKNRAKKLKEQ
jgi:tetratricopeptide (TPR) repeat protein